MMRGWHGAWSRNEVVDGVYRLDEGAVLDDFCQFLREVGVFAWMESVQGTALPREMVPVVPSRWRDGRKTLLGIERIQARPALRFSDDALRPWVGCNAQQVRHGVCPRGASTRQRPRTAGPMGPETLANALVPLHLRDLAGWCNGTIRALAKAGLLGA